jgi:DNA helicase INO80
MAELWALLHFIMPTLFDSHDEFNEWFSKDIESHAEKKSTLDENQLSRLHMILKPFMLRRIKKDVEHEMAPKVEVELSCPLTPLQQRIYQRLRNKITVEELLQNSTVAGDSSRTSSLMNLVMQFRKVCNHVELFERREARSPLLFTLPAYNLPRLLYDEGILFKTSRSRWKLLTVAFGIFSADHIHKGFYGDFGALRLAGFSPSEVRDLATGGSALRLRVIMEILKRLTIAYKQWVWSSSSAHPPLQLWPVLRLSPFSIKDSSVLSSLVIVTPGTPSLPTYGYTSHDSHVMVHEDEPTMCNGSVSPTSSVSSASTWTEERSYRPRETNTCDTAEYQWSPLPSFVTVATEQVSLHDYCSLQCNFLFLFSQV